MPPQPLLSEQAAFAKHLFIQGYPLWSPDPELLPQARQSIGLRIGDVGTVDERGRFDLFFNILDPLPPNFPPIEEDDSNFRSSSEDLVPLQVISSPETTWDVGQLEPEVTHGATQYDTTLSDDGSHIILPRGAQSFELGPRHRRLLENYARERGADWLERFRDHLGWPRSNSIYLVTGLYKTCSWSIASFSTRSAGKTDPIRVHCKLVEEKEQIIWEDSVWQPADRFKRKIGPPPDRRGQNNQTIFIRAITITPNLIEQEPSEQREFGLPGSLSSPPRSLNSQAGDSNRETATETPKSNVIVQHVPHISHVSHPSEIINKYLLTKEPSAEIAVTHDSQWIAMLKLLEVGQSWTLEDLENRLEALVPVQYSIATHKDTVYLRDKDHESSTEYTILRNTKARDKEHKSPTECAISRNTNAVDLNDMPDLTKTLLLGSKRLAGGGSFCTVYRCLCAWNGEVAVKTICFPRSLDQTEREEFLRKMRRELEIWKRLDHPNIVPFFGTAQGEDFGSEHPCMVSMWMPHGTLAEYVWGCDNELSLPDRVRLITGSVAGLEYLHSNYIVHGDFHPGNILIDGYHTPRLTDFGFSQTLKPLQDDLSYLWTSCVRPGATMWAAPELLHPDLFPDAVDIKLDLNIDIYSLGSIILFILSGKLPRNRQECEGEYQNPPRPLWPIIPDLVWNFIERCWSPRVPRNRPLAQEVLSFSRDRLQQLLQPNPDSDINVVLFGAVGCGKSSLINLLTEEPIAPVSTNTEPCTKRPQYYKMSIGERRFRLWDTTGFRPPRAGDFSRLSPYEQAHAVLQNLPDGVHLILLCVRKDEITPSLGSLYWLIHDFFFGGRAPVAFVVTHFDTPDQRWWERNRRLITRTGIPIQSIPCASSTTVQTGRDESRQTLRVLLANARSSISLRLNLSSHEAASLDIATHCGLSKSDAAALVKRFSEARNVVKDSP